MCAQRIRPAVQALAWSARRGGIYEYTKLQLLHGPNGATKPKCGRVQMCASTLAHAHERFCVCDDINDISGRVDGNEIERDSSMTVEEQIAQIKANMPQVYKSIQAKAAAIGKPAFALVRRGLRGEANCFYAFEQGHVVGAPFNQGDVMPEIARYMVQFGCDHIVIWANEGATDGAH